MTPDFYDKVQRAVASIRSRSGLVPEVAIIAGTGLGPMLDDIEIDADIAYGEIDEFPVSTAPSHAGRMIIGRLHGHAVIALSGRFHAYEGWSNDELVLPVYTLHQLGAGRLIVTNASGGLNPDLAVPSIMLIEDHISLLGVYPLTGPNDDRLGVRFPDLSQAYDKEMRAAAVQTADELGLPLERGIYVACHGPALETSAERRFCRLIGGDVVGMSTVLEVVAANHVGMRVLGFSVVGNAATGGDDQQPDTLEDILASVHRVAGDLRGLIAEMLRGKRL